MFDFLFLRSKGSQYMRAALLSTMLLSSAHPLLATGYPDEEHGNAASATNHEGGSSASARQRTFSLAYPLWSREGFNKEEGDFAARGGAPSAENPLSEREDTPIRRMSRSVFKDPNVGLKNSPTDLACCMLPSVLLDHISREVSAYDLEPDFNVTDYPSYEPQPNHWEEGQWEGAVDFFQGLLIPSETFKGSYDPEKDHHPLSLAGIKDRAKESPILDLHWRNMGFLDALILARNLQEASSQFNAINLQHNKIGCLGGMAIVAALSKQTALTALNLGDTSVSPEVAMTIARSLSNHKALRTLNLSGNDLGYGGPTPISEILKLPGLTKLDISRNHILAMKEQRQLQRLSRHILQSSR